jgi:O-methyltransferase
VIPNRHPSCMMSAAQGIKPMRFGQGVMYAASGLNPHDSDGSRRKYPPPPRKPSLLRLGRQLFRRIGLDVVPYHKGIADRYPPDFEPRYLEIIERARPNSMTSPERLHGLCVAVEYVVSNRIPGAIVECGVWRGGSMMAAASVLTLLGDTGRDLWLYDTFEGMTSPGEFDISASGGRAADLLAASTSERGVLARASLETVKSVMDSAGYGGGEIHYVKGPVEKTIPGQVPESIAILRLDTDWYESTRHELFHLFPRIRANGILIIDDYGDWQGARKAVDEYLESVDDPVLLQRIDQTGRMAVVPCPCPDQD